MKTAWILLAAMCLGACANIGKPSIQSANGLQGSWQLIETASTAVPTEGPRAKVLQFDTEQSRVSGSAGCNQLMSAYASNGQLIQFKGVASTRMACSPDSVMQFEYKVIRNLESVSSWRIDGDKLLLLDASKNTVLKLKRI